MTRPLLITALLVFAGAAPGQVSDTVPFHGSEFFRFALHQNELRPVTDPAEAMLSPTTSVIIVVGNSVDLLRYCPPRTLREFVENGGAVLVAANGPAGINLGWEREFGFSISGQALKAERQSSYGETETRPFARPLKPNPQRIRHTAFDLFERVPPDGPTAVATDYPTELTVVPGPAKDWDRLAGYPDSTRRIADDQRIPAETYFALSHQVAFGSGRMLVLGSPWVFANGMMGFERDQTQPNGYRLTNGNWDFANRVILWLRSGPLQLRTQCLFIENGMIKNEFAYKLPRPPAPNIPPDVLANILLNHSNGVMNELQEKNFFNRAMEGFFGFPRIVRGFLLVATALFLFYGLRWLIRGYRKHEPAAVTSPDQQAALLPRGGVLRQRTAAQIEVGNLSEAAGRRVRDRFDVLGGRPGPAGGKPPVLIANDVPDAPLLRQTVHRLWEIGYGETPVNVPPTEWDRVNALLERVTARAARGDWSFGQDVA